MRTTEPTRRGWALLGAGAGLFIAGRMLGTIELSMLATAAVVLLVGAVLWVRSREIDLSISRTVQPGHVEVGADARVDLAARNHSSRRSPQLALTEEFDGGRRAARFLVPALSPGATVRAAYRVPTDHRGWFRVGPARAMVLDAFGLAQREVSIPGETEIVVRPRVHTLHATPPAPGRRRAPSAFTTRLHAPASGSDDFLTLRRYDVGDDLRRVHWKSTARTDELMVRQDEARWESRTIVLLDTRATGDPAAFEVAVEAVASIVVRLAREGRRFEVRTASGRVLARRSGRGSSTARPSLGALLDELALVEAGGPDALAPLMNALAHVDAGSALLVAVTPALGAATAPLTRVAPAVPVVLVTTGAADVAAGRGSPAGMRRGRRDGVTVVDAGRAPLARAWDDALRGPSVATGRDRRGGPGAGPTAWTTGAETR